MYAQSHYTADESILTVEVTPVSRVRVIVSNPVENTVVEMTPAQAHALGVMFMDAAQDAGHQLQQQINAAALADAQRFAQGVAS